MIESKSVTTYSQYNEDIIMAALLHDVNKGFYIDVGANDPVIDSVTKYFYDKGWNGINIEPLKKYASAYAKLRKKDINLGCGVGDKPGVATIREYEHIPGHSTFDDLQKDNQDDFTEYSVDIKTLAQIVKENKVKNVDFLKIDVEGYEYEVIIGNDWSKCAPKVLCIESNHGTKDWRSIIAKNGYKLFIQDGLNEYYVHNKYWHLTDNFAERAILLDYYALKQHQSDAWNADTILIANLTSENKTKADEIESLKSYVQLSLHQRTYIGRVKRAFIGLTSDYFKYKKNVK